MGEPAPRLPETLYPLTPHDERVLAQTLAFEAALPSLMAEHQGRWAVWLDGLRSVHDTHASARRWARTHLDRESPFVLARVEARTPIPIASFHWPR
jgi:hypothetical protein